MRTDDQAAAAGIFHDLIVVDADNRSILPITPVIRGVTCSLNEKKIFIHTSREIILYDVSSPGEIAVEPLYHVEGHSDIYIENLEWVAGPLISFFVRRPYQEDVKILYDYKKKSVTASETIDTKLNSRKIVYWKELDFNDHEKQQFWFIRLSTNKNADFASDHLQKLKKKYPVFMVEENRRFMLYLGPYNSEEARDKLSKVREEGYKDAYLEEKELFHFYSSEDLTKWYLTENNIFKIEKNQGRSFFKNSAPVTVAALFHNMLYIVQNRRLYSLDLNTDKLTPLTICFEDSSAFDGDLSAPPVAVYDKKEDVILVKTEGHEYYRLDKNGIINGQYRPGPGVTLFSDRQQDEVHYPNLIKMAEKKYYQLKDKGPAPEFTLDFPGENKTLKVRFIFLPPMAGWVNSGRISSGDGEYVILEAVTNM